MKVRARITLTPGAKFGSPPPRRSFIYPHRSVRTAPLTLDRIASALVLAFSLSLAMGLGSERVLAVHAGLSRLLLDWAGIDVKTWFSCSLFPLLPSVPAPAVSIPAYKDIPETASFILIIAITALAFVFRRISLARSVVGFAIVLLAASAASVALNPHYWFDSVTFTQLWLRSEILLWFALPWVSAFLFVAIQPNPWAGVACVLAVQVWAFVFSALRMTFCLGVLHYSGMLFFPVLWFFLGLFLTIAALQTAYSLSVHSAAENIRVRRAI